MICLDSWFPLSRVILSGYLQDQSVSPQLLRIIGGLQSPTYRALRAKRRDSVSNEL